MTRLTIDVATNTDGFFPLTTHLTKMEAQLQWKYQRFGLEIRHSPQPVPFEGDTVLISDGSR